MRVVTTSARLCVFVLLAVVSIAHAATPLARVSGVVTDESGDPIEGVKAQLCGMETLQNGVWKRVYRWGIRPYWTTDKQGRFTIEFGEPDIRYDLLFEKRGLAPTFLYGISAESGELKVVLREGVIVTGTDTRLVEGVDIEIGDGVTVSGPDFAAPLEVREKKKRPEGLKTIDRSDQPTVHARHILVLVPAGSDESVKMQSLAEAERIRAALIAGTDFEMTAKQHSACPSKERGGDLGSFRRGQMVKPFEEAAFSQKVGKIGPVVYTKFGYHIIQVLDREHE